MREWTPSDRVPTLNYAASASVQGRRERDVLRTLNFVGALFSLFLAFLYGLEFVASTIGHDDTVLLQADGVLPMLIAPGLVFTGTVLLATLIERRRWPAQRPYWVALLAHIVALATPWLWDLRADWW